MAVRSAVWPTEERRAYGRGWSQGQRGVRRADAYGDGDFGVTGNPSESGAGGVREAGHDGAGGDWRPDDGMERPVAFAGGGRECEVDDAGIHRGRVGGEGEGDRGAPAVLHEGNSTRGPGPSQWYGAVCRVMGIR